jgi:IS5 family transposase
MRLGQPIPCALLVILRTGPHALTSFRCEMGTLSLAQNDGIRYDMEGMQTKPYRTGAKTMLIEKYEPVNLFDLVPLARDEVLDELDQLLEEDALFQNVKSDLAQRHPHTLTQGRHSTPVEVILRMLVVKHLYSWSYEKTEIFVSDSITLRQFCRVYLNPVPDDTTLIKWANLVQPETLHRLLEHVVVMAQRLKVTRGRKLRTDGTVVESNIHHPTDSSLLVDGVRVLGRTLSRARKVVASTATEVGQMAKKVFRNRLRSARKAARQISNATRKRTQESRERSRGAYQKLVEIAQKSMEQAHEVVEMLQEVATQEAQLLSEQLEHFLPLVEQVIEQTVRRVVDGEKVPAQEKIVSIFEPHTDIIRRGKSDRPTEFGHKVWLDEVEGGIVSDYRVLTGNPQDDSQWAASLQHHRELFGRPPDQASGDRGLYSPDNEDLAKAMGVHRIVLPKPGHRSAARKQHERQRWFRRGRRYHQGVEGRISVLKRRHGLDRCLYHGEDGFERWVGWGLIAHNLLSIGTVLAAR